MTTLLLIVVWLVSLIMLPMHGNGFWAPKAIAWLLGSWALVAAQWLWPLRRVARREPWLAGLLLWWGALFWWTVLRHHMLLPNVVERQVPVLWVLSPLLPTMLGVGSLLAWDVLRRAEIDWPRVQTHLIGLGLLLGLYALAQVLYLDPFELGPRAGTRMLRPNSAVTVFGNQMLTGNALAVLAALAIGRAKWPCWLILLPALALTRSATSVAAFLVAWALTGPKPWLWLPALGLAGLGLYLTPLTQPWFALHDRPAMWASAWELLRAHPLNLWIGFGLGSVEAATTNGRWNYGWLHCEPLQVVFETGLVGLVLATGWLGTTARRVWSARQRVPVGWQAAAVTYGLLSLVAFPLRIGSLLLFGVLIAAALVAHTEGDRYVSA